MKIVGVIAVVIAIVSLGGFAIFSSSNKSAPNNSSSSTSSSSTSSSFSSSLTSSITINSILMSSSQSITDLTITDTLVGDGAELQSGQSATFHYTGTLENGTKFDSSLDRGTPFTTTIGVGEVIPGWDQGIPGMKIGGKRKLVIPGSLAYGPRGIPNAGIGPNATLIFEVELLAIA